MYPRLVRRRQVAAAVGWQRDTRRATYQDNRWSATLRGVWSGDLEQPARRSTDFLTVHGHICEKT